MPQMFFPSNKAYLSLSQRKTTTCLLSIKFLPKLPSTKKVARFKQKLHFIWIMWTCLLKWRNSNFWLNKHVLSLMCYETCVTFVIFYYNYPQLAKAIWYVNHFKSRKAKGWAFTMVTSITYHHILLRSMKLAFLS